MSKCISCINDNTPLKGCATNCKHCDTSLKTEFYLSCFEQMESSVLFFWQSLFSPLWVFPLDGGAPKNVHVCLKIRGFKFASFSL